MDFEKYLSVIQRFLLHKDEITVFDLKLMVQKQVTANPNEQQGVQKPTETGLTSALLIRRRYRPNMHHMEKGTSYSTGTGTTDTQATGSYRPGLFSL